jgi:hypothetical protein
MLKKQSALHAVAEEAAWNPDFAGILSGDWTRTPGWAGTPASFFFGRGSDRLCSTSMQVSLEFVASVQLEAVTIAISGRVSIADGNALLKITSALRIACANVRSDQRTPTRPSSRHRSTYNAVTALLQASQPHSHGISDVDVSLHSSP